MAPDSKVTRPCVALSKSSAASTISGAGLRRGKCPHDYKASRISKMVLSTVNLGPTKLDKIKNFHHYLHPESVINRPHHRLAMRPGGNRVVSSQ